ncbi:hypothetical protein STCU_02050 [Strigomonas culicis]|uniref:Uncharacterized protein n=1 Tax=Strigomonas culicis TaxID=28005 RepID=S9W2Z4_9TRYP|nr:hypothetical protein STCU_02050 [Strigomonas culicis]|eukprot:EPY33716.1 hypothetical protein STCU_02050 [Strigomonas culicis]
MCARAYICEIDCVCSLSSFFSYLAIYVRKAIQLYLYLYTHTRICAMPAATVPSSEVSDFWSNPVDHFRPNFKALSLYFDHNYVVDRWLHAKERWLKPFYLPTWSPLYQVMTWYSQRNRNLLLVENNLNYRPYRYRRNDENRNNPY